MKKKMSEFVKVLRYLCLSCVVVFALIAMVGHAEGAESVSILIDDYHDTDGDSLTGNLSEMKAALEARGHSIEALEEELTAEKINAYDIFMIYDYEYPFSASEISVIDCWLQQGGRLMVAGASRYSDDNGASLDAILNPLGISFGNEITSAVLDSFVTHDITAGVQALSVGADFTVVHGGTAIGSYNGNVGLAVLNNGYKVVVVGSSKVFCNPYFRNHDEASFLINSAEWLSSNDAIVGNGYLVTSDLWIRAVINTEEKGPIEAVWQKGGEDTTSRGDRVMWGHFYASPDDVTWGSQSNPDLFVKIWFDVSGRVDVNYFHVSVPDIEVYSDYPYDGTVDEYGTTSMSRRYIRQYYQNGESNMDENYEDGNPPSGYSPTGNPSGYSTINDLRIGSMINTVEKGPIDALWRLGGQDTTSRGDQVVWGHFYASPSDVTWGSQNNPDLFVKIWFDVSGRTDVNFFHVSVPDIEVYSDLPYDGTYGQKGTTIMDNRYIRHEYWR